MVTDLTSALKSEDFMHRSIDTSLASIEDTTHLVLQCPHHTKAGDEMFELLYDSYAYDSFGAPMATGIPAMLLNMKCMCFA